jgi:hypothetical protein
MKRAFAIFFLIVFVFQSTSTVWILASFYAQRDYISKNLCINRFDAIPVCKGQCYLNKQLKENEKKEQNLPDLKQKEIQLFCQNNLSFEFPKTILEERLNTLNFKDNFLSSDYLFSVFRPPQNV